MSEVVSIECGGTLSISQNFVSLHRELKSVRTLTGVSGCCWQ